MTGRAEDLDSSDDTGEDFALVQTVPPTAPEGYSPRASAGRYAQGAIVASKYRLATILGEGGMGSVWVAKNRTLDVDVALKLMRAELADDVDGVAERMLQEARAAASIGHPAIVQVFDFGFTEFGDPFIAMELLRGESLGEAIKSRGQVRPTRALQTLLPIVDALGAAHLSGIVHRDMKPENIFLARPAGNRLQPKVLDFGIAKLEQRAAERITRDGAVIGSPAYMAPEQLRGEPDVDARADIWALCVVLYQMLTGRRPFEGDSYHASMWNVLNGAPRPIAEHGVDEPELWDILLRGLSKAKEARYPDARSFGRALAEWLIARGVNEDVTDASLKAWTEAGPGGVRIHSFFPSQEPSLRKPAATEETPKNQPNLLESSGTRRIGAVLGAQKAPAEPTLPRVEGLVRSVSERRILLVTALSALAAFVGAALYAVVSAEPSREHDAADEASEVRRAPPRARRPSAAAPVAPRPPVLDGVPPPAPAAPVEARVTEPARPRAPLKIPHRTQPARAPARGPSSKSELKDPFQ